ncbi:MAG: Nramp family divalent metal transporter [Brumimicrobium sp.]|nr:Nramp family divalent metal transporter [Brumimicrobium sp.]MCO5269693.1 Nramp family divalent metal transporter [Brumimicrobium sp.]
MRLYLFSTTFVKTKYLKLNNNHKSLEEVHESVDPSLKKSGWKRLLAFLGPAYLVSVGYMDPGNWATGIEAGSQFGYTLIWVILMSNIMALLLQTLSTRLGIVRGLDLAQASRHTYNPIVNFSLYILAEIAIVACDLAEVIGMAIGLNLLFGLPMIWGVAITALDSFILLFLLHKGIRKMEAFILMLIIIIGISFFIQMFIAEPDMHGVIEGFIPSIPNSTALYIAIGIIGATVMPHNLYLHSSLVQSRKIERTTKGIKEALRFNFIDSAIALNMAFFVNAAILILAASTFYSNGIHVAEIQDAHQMLEPLLGTKWAPMLFALALIAAGQSSTITGTLAGQIVMEGHLNLRIQPWVRRLITRLLAIVPAIVAILYFGESSTGKLLVLSQVVLSLQLGFAIIPLIHFVSSKELMKGFHIKTTLKIASWFITLIIVGFNIGLAYNEINRWLESVEQPLFIWIFVVPFAISLLLLLIYITCEPFIAKRSFKKKNMVPHITNVDMGKLQQSRQYQHIAIAVDFSESDKRSISTALQLGGNTAKYTLIHVVETVGAKIYGKETQDFETNSDQQYLQNYQAQLQSQGYTIETKLGFGIPKNSIPEIVNNSDVDLLILGAHGHTGIKDWLFGTTVDAVRHRVKVSVMIVKDN